MRRLIIACLLMFTLMMGFALAGKSYSSGSRSSSSSRSYSSGSRSSSSKSYSSGSSRSYSSPSKSYSSGGSRSYTTPSKPSAPSRPSYTPSYSHTTPRSPSQPAASSPSYIPIPIFIPSGHNRSVDKPTTATAQTKPEVKEFGKSSSYWGWGIFTVIGIGVLIGILVWRSQCSY